MSSTLCYLGSLLLARVIKESKRDFLSSRLHAVLRGALSAFHSVHSREDSLKEQNAQGQSSPLQERAPTKSVSVCVWGGGGGEGRGVAGDLHIWFRCDVITLKSHQRA